LNGEVTFEMTETENVRQDVIASMKNGIRYCSKCNSVLWKKTGCDWITCRACNTAQCSLCGFLGDHVSHTCNQANHVENISQKTVQRIGAATNDPQICVTLPNGATIKVSFTDKDMTVAVLKQKIRQTAGYAADQPLTLASPSGRLMEDGVKLSEYQIRNRQMVNVTTDVNGG
jgi:hypothetical protein